MRYLDFFDTFLHPFSLGDDIGYVPGSRSARQIRQIMQLFIYSFSSQLPVHHNKPFTPIRRGKDTLFLLIPSNIKIKCLEHNILGTFWMLDELHEISHVSQPDGRVGLLQCCIGPLECFRGLSKALRDVTGAY